MNKLSALCAALLLAACGNPHERYVGHWQPAAKGADPYRVLEIGKSADGNYRLRRDVLSAHPADETLLALADGSLSNTGGSRLTLSDDGQTLQLADAPYRRLPDSEIEPLRAQAQSAAAEQENNRQRCQSLLAEYANRKLVLGKPDVTTPKEVWSKVVEQHQRLEAEYRAKTQQIRGCSL